MSVRRAKEGQRDAMTQLKGEWFLTEGEGLKELTSSVSGFCG
jgi:hypothetical protein